MSFIPLIPPDAHMHFRGYASLEEIDRYGPNAVANITKATAEKTFRYIVSKLTTVTDIDNGILRGKVVDVDVIAISRADYEAAMMHAYNVGLRDWQGRHV